MPNYLTSPTCWVLFFGCLAATAVLTPVAMRLARLVGAVDRGGYRKVYEGNMPLLGGLAIALPFLAICILGFFSPTTMFATIRKERFDLVVLGIACAIIVGLGVVDDTRGLRARWKFLVQLVAALFVCVTSGPITVIGIPFIGNIELGIVFGTIVAVFWLVGLSNAFNLIDGVDGLAAGVAFISSAALAVIAAMNGATFVVLLCIGLSGSLLAFLAYNSHPAKIFLGNTGSLFLGFALAGIALIGGYKSSAAVVFLAPMLALGLPIFETLFSMLRRAIRGRPLFTGDLGHIHHRLLKRGFTQRQVALMLYAGAAVCMVAAILSNVLSQKVRNMWIPIALYSAAILIISWIAGYLRPREAMSISARHQRNRLLSTFACYASMKFSTNSSPVTLEEVLEMGCRELRLHFLEIWHGNRLLLAVSNHSTAEETGKYGTPNPVREIKIRSANGQTLVARYQHDHVPDEQEHQDVAACLAHLFEQAKIETLTDLGQRAHHLKQLA